MKSYNMMGNYVTKLDTKDDSLASKQSCVSNDTLHGRIKSLRMNKLSNIKSLNFIYNSEAPQDVRVF